MVAAKLVIQILQETLLVYPLLLRFRDELRKRKARQKSPNQPTQ